MAGTRRRALVLTRNGRTTVITGWWAWLMGFAAMLLAWLLLALALFTLIGVALTVGIIVLLLIPAVAIVALLGMLLGRKI
jgi:hypothetical protein